MKNEPREVDTLTSHARRTGNGTIDVVLAVRGHRFAAGDAKVRLRAGKNVIRAAAAVDENGVVHFSVPQKGLQRAEWRLAVRTAGDEEFVRVPARLLAPPGQPAALLSGPGPQAVASSTPAASTLKRGLRKGARRGRKVASRVRRQVREAGDAGGPALGVDPVSGSTSPSDAVEPPAPPAQAPAPVAPAASPRARLTQAGALKEPLSLLSTDIEHALLLTTPDTTKAAARWVKQLSPASVTVVLLTADPQEAERWSPPQGTPGSTVTTGVATGRDTLLQHVQALPRLDLVVATFPDDDESVWPDGSDLVPILFPYVSRGGGYLQDRSTEGAVAFPWWLSRLAGAPAEGGRREERERDAMLSGAIGTVVVAPNLVLTTKRQRHYLKIREEQVPDLLAAREPDLDVTILGSRAGGSLTPATQEQSYGPRFGDPWPDRIDYPSMSLRHYRGTIDAGGGMLLSSGDSVLPESFRWPHAPVLGNFRLISTGEIARIKKVDRPRGNRLKGSYFHFDCAFAGHFGHFATETVSRLWGWDEAKRAIPDLKAFYTVDPGDPLQGGVEREFLRAYGIADDDIVSVDRPVTLESVVGASPMWENTDPFYVHPDIREVWDRLSAGLLTGPPSPHERIFVSRGVELNHRRGCRNAAEVEALFADRGFHIFYPEDLPLPEQASLFAGAKVVAGYGGSAMANLMHSRNLEATIVLSHHSYVARNEHLYLSLLGGEFHYFWAPSDVSPPRPGGRTKQSVRSSWEFDMAGSGDDLRRVLAAL